SAHMISPRSTVMLGKVMPSMAVTGSILITGAMMLGPGPSYGPVYFSHFTVLFIISILLSRPESWRRAENKIIIGIYILPIVLIAVVYLTSIGWASDPGLWLRRSLMFSYCVVAMLTVVFSLSENENVFRLAVKIALAITILQIAVAVVETIKIGRAHV